MTDRPEIQKLAPLPAEALGTVGGRGRLAGRKIIVVGAGTMPAFGDEPTIGNGRAIAILCAREGASVICSDISLDAAEETAKIIRSEGGVAYAIRADATDEKACNALASATADRLGGVDGLVLNVGISVGAGPIETSLRDWDKAFDVNVKGHLLAVRATLPLMSAGSSLVFVSSTAGQAPGPDAPYSITKAAVEALSRNIASQYASKGIRSNVVAPHTIDTPLGRQYVRDGGLGDVSDLVQFAGPMNRVGTPWEVAYSVVFLLSNEASYTTGSVLYVDGGWMLQGAHNTKTEAS